MSNEEDIRELRRRVETLESEKKSWSEYRELILSELNRLQAWLEQASTQTATKDTALVEKLAKLTADLTKAIVDKLAPVEAKVNTNVTEIGKLSVKAGVWGAVAGLIPASIVLIWWLVK